MARHALLLAALWLCAASTLAGDLKVDRTIGKEPQYETKSPKYGLLLFGREGKDRVWLVHDGSFLYVDRNGNGDLTDPGEKVAAVRIPGRDPEKEGYQFAVGDITVGGVTHKDL